LTLLIEFVPQGMPFHAGHHVVEQPSSLTRIEDRQDVIVRESCRQLDLAKKALCADLLGYSGRRTFTATERSWRKSRARCTTAIPPAVEQRDTALTAASRGLMPDIEHQAA